MKAHFFKLAQIEALDKAGNWSYLWQNLECSENYPNRDSLVQPVYDTWKEPGQN